MKPAEDAVFAMIGDAVGPVVSWGAAKCFVEVQLLTGGGDHRGNVVAVGGWERCLVERGVMVEGEEVIVNVATREGW